MVEKSDFNETKWKPSRWIRLLQHKVVVKKQAEVGLNVVLDGQADSLIESWTDGWIDDHT